MKNLILLALLPLALLSSCQCDRTEPKPVERYRTRLNAKVNTVLPAPGAWKVYDDRGTETVVRGSVCLNLKSGGGLGIVVLEDTSRMPYCCGSRQLIFSTEKPRISAVLKDDKQISIMEDGVEKVKFDMALCGCLLLESRIEHAERPEVASAVVSSTCQVQRTP